MQRATIVFILAFASLSAFGQAGQNWKDDKTGLLWTDTDSGEPMSWANADSYCKALGSGWRMPAMSELTALYQRTQFKNGVTLRSANTVLWTADKTGNTALAAVVVKGLVSKPVPLDNTHPVTLCVKKPGLF